MNNREGETMPLRGVIVVDKPLGLSSMDVVRHVRRAVGKVTVQGKNGRPKKKWAKVGHGGTLDPLATGVVVVCVGKATKSVSKLMGMTKVYEAEVDLSAFTMTDDAEAEREEVHVQRVPSDEDVRGACDDLTGEIMQVPPAYSAVHVDGRRAYKLARAGQDVEIEPRPVTIHAIEILDYAWPKLQLRITCGKGTYIRSIARDLGKALATGGYLTALRRTVVGQFKVEDAVKIERFEDGCAMLEQGELMGVEG